MKSFQKNLERLRRVVYRRVNGLNDLGNVSSAVQGFQTNFDLIYRTLASLSSGGGGGGGSTGAANVVVVTKNADDPFGGSIQAAIDSITDESATNPYIVDVRSPGVYEENVVLKPNVNLVSLNGGPASTTQIQSSSGTTLTVPGNGCSISNIAVVTSGSTTSDYAVQVTNDGDPFAAPTTFEFCRLATLGNGARMYRQAANDNQSVLMFVTFLQPGNADIGMLVESGSILFFIGGTVDACTTLLQLGDGTERAQANFVDSFLSADQNGGGYVFDVLNNSSLQLGSGVTIPDADNVMRIRSGATAIVNTMSIFDQPTNNVFDVDAGGQLFLGNGVESPDFANNYGKWNIQGTLTPIYNPYFGAGTISGPDTRPANPVVGMTWIATDANTPGGSPPAILTYDPGFGGWRDFQGNLFP